MYIIKLIFLELNKPENIQKGDPAVQEKNPKQAWPRDHGHFSQLHHVFQTVEKI